MVTCIGNIGKVGITKLEITAFNQQINAIVVNDNFIPRYIGYNLLFNKKRLEFIANAPVVPIVNKKDFSEFKIKVLLDKNKQNDIVTILDCVSSLIENNKKILEGLDYLIKGRFVEMFGNPLEITKESRYMKEFLTINPLKRELSDKEDIMVSFVPMENVGEDGSFSIKEEGPISNYNKGYTYFKDGDVLLAKITPCFENGKIAIAKNCKNGVGFGSTEFHVFRCDNRLCDPVWVKYLLKNEHVHEYAKINMTGSAGQKRIQKSFFENLRTILPNLDVQNQFADFVRQIDKSKVVCKEILR